MGINALSGECSGDSFGGGRGRVQLRSGGEIPAGGFGRREFGGSGRCLNLNCEELS
jgi:hypothetical protein